MLYHETRALRISTLVCSTSNSGSMVTGRMLLSTIDFQHITTAWSSCTQRTETSSGQLYWRRPTPSKCVARLVTAPCIAKFSHFKYKNYCGLTYFNILSWLVSLLYKIYNFEAAHFVTVCNIIVMCNILGYCNVGRPIYNKLIGNLVVFHFTQDNYLVF